MAVLVSYPCALRSMEAVLKAIIDFVTPNNETEYRHLGRIERLYMEVIAAGDRLLAAQRAEAAFRPPCDNSYGDDGLEEWKSYRKTVDTLAEEYLAAIKAWRIVLEEQLNAAAPAAPQGNWWRS